MPNPATVAPFTATTNGTVVAPGSIQGKFLRDDNTFQTVAGVTGPTGAAGSAGAPGAPGAAGVPGAVGATGPAGSAGTPGTVGATGPKGATGSPGAAGPVGPVGSTGPAGATGPQGIQGIPGSGGGTGAAGPDGIVDVKRDFGAVGDGVTFDHVAIQNAIDAAFGPASAPHGLNGAKNNKVLRFPAGTYRLGAPLKMTQVYGGHIYGAGPGSTMLLYDGGFSTGVIPSGDNPSAASFADYANAVGCLFTNGMHSCIFERFSFAGPAASANASNGNVILFGLDWDGVVPLNSTGNTVRDCTFSNGTFCLDIGRGFQTDGTLLENIVMTNAYNGSTAYNFNALNHTVIGGGAAEIRNVAFWGPGGNFTDIIGTQFSGNGIDIFMASGTPTNIDGVSTESTNFAYIMAGSIKNCEQRSSVPGFFWNSTAALPTSIENCLTTRGRLVSNQFPILYIRNFTPNSDPTYAFADPLARFGDGRPNDFGFQGTLVEWVLPPNTFAAIPAYTKVNGLECRITDSPTITFRAPITAGGGPYTVKARVNGGQWVVSG